MHTEQALFEAGASDGHCYEIVGVSYTPADASAGTTDTASVDLSTPDQTGCLLTHDYSTGETTLKWDGLDRYGVDEDVQTAIEDITRGRFDANELFTAFQDLMTRAGATL